MKGNERPVRTGGLMRCCTATLSEIDEELAVGSEIRCRYCGQVMRIAPDGIWEGVFPEKDNE